MPSEYNISTVKTDNSQQFDGRHVPTNTGCFFSFHFRSAQGLTVRCYVLCIRYSSGIQNKDSQIETLTAEAAGAKETVQNLETELKGKEETVVKLETQLTEKEETIKELNDSIVEKDGTIDELTAQVRNLQATVQTAVQEPEPKQEAEPEPKQEPEKKQETTGTTALATTKPGVKMDFDKYTLSGPEKISVVITVTNTGEEDMLEPVTLYYPDGTKAEAFGNSGLSAGKSRSWVGEWDVTQEQLDKGNVTFSIRYAIYDGEPDKDGVPALRQHKMNFSKKISQKK